MRMVFSAVRPIVMSLSVSSIVVAMELGESMCSFGISNPSHIVAKSSDRVKYMDATAPMREGDKIKAVVDKKQPGALVFERA